MTKIKKVVLAYSGGLDTSVMIRWLIENHGCEVIAVYGDLGQGEGENVEAVRNKALKTGASKVYIEDLKQEFLNHFCLPTLFAHAVYEEHYLLSAALSRPLIAQRLVDIAQQEGAQAVAHGSTGKGNDQVRFDVSVMALDPALKILAPVRTWNFKSRQQEIEYARQHNIPVEATKEKPYSIDRNLWGVSIECGVLEDPWVEPPEDAYLLTASPAKAPHEPLYLELGFTRGVPTHLNGEKMPLVNLMEQLTQLGGRHGVGRSDMVENRLVGIKSREIYEAPAATILYRAHAELEKLVLDRETLQFKSGLSQKYAQLVYNGLWFSPLRQALDGFFGYIQQWVSGTVRLRLYKGCCTVVGRKSEHSLYHHKLATYDAGDVFEHAAGEAFCKIWGLPLRVLAERNQKRHEK